MVKLILISVLMVTVTLPLLAAREPNGRRGFKRMLLGLLLFNLFYAALVTLVVTRYVPEWFE